MTLLYFLMSVITCDLFDANDMAGKETVSYFSSSETPECFKPR